MRRPEFIARQAANPSGFIGRLLVRLMARETRAFNREVVAALAPKSGERIVEIGFGHGATLAEIAATVPGVELAGIDVSADAARVAAARCPKTIDLRVGDSADLPWADASFDKTYAVHTVYFWGDPLRNLCELRRVLRPRGVLVLGLRERTDRAVATFPASTYRFYSLDEIDTLLRTAGFAKAEICEATSGGDDLRIVIARAAPRE